ncbi:DUF4175 family protein, partial [Tautonia sociabilis]|uniref:DUF4175 family protein n=1 Tax=Tautonia sociabilis TaxID=2080755 RepID=UPI0013151EEC
MALGTEPRPSQGGRMLDYEQFVDHQLHQTRSRIRATEVFTAVVVMATVVLGILLLEIVLDHWVGLPRAIRAAVLLVAGATGAYAMYRFVLLPLLSSVNNFYAARKIEAFDPRFKNSLLNYIDLRRRREELPPAVLRALESRAVKDLAAVQVEAAVDQRQLTRAFYALAAVVVLFCLYVVLTPKNVLDSARRALLADVARPTNTRLMNILPGDDAERARVVSGSDVLFSAEVDSRGLRPDEIRLHYSADGGDYFDSTPLDEGERRYDPWSVTLKNVQQELIYYLTANDYRSKDYRLTVMPAPRVVSVAHDLDFPDYTGVPRRAGVEGGNIRALEGTIVTIRARTNLPARGGHLDLDEMGTARLVASPSDPQELTGRFKLERNGSYTIKFETTEGQLNPEPVIYDIEALPDRRPEVRFTSPAQERAEVPANARIGLSLSASDDFGLDSVRLVVQRAKQDVIPERDLTEGREPSRTLEHTEPLDLAALGLRPGDRLTYWAEVRDNRAPSPQSVESGIRIIEVIEPVEEPEAPPPDENAPQDQPPRDQPQSPDQPDPDRVPRQDAPPQPSPDQPPAGADQPPRDRSQDQGQGQGQGQEREGSGQGRSQGQPQEQPEADRSPAGSDSGASQSRPLPNDRPLSPEDQERLDRLRQAFDQLDQDRQSSQNAPPPNQQNQPPQPGNPPSGDQPQRENQQAGDQPQRGNQPSGDQPRGGNQPRRGDQQGGDQQPGDQPQGGNQPRGDQQRGDQPQGGNQQRGNQQRGDQQRGDQPQGGDQQPGDQPQGGNQPQGGDQQRGDQQRGG